MRNTIRFTTNWNNKLLNKAFTTIRIHNPNKYIVGSVYNIELNGKPQGKAILRIIKTLRLSQLNDFICFIDTGYNKEHTTQILSRMYPGVNLNEVLFDFCLLVNQPRKPEIHKHPKQGVLKLPYKD